MSSHHVSWFLEHSNEYTVLKWPHQSANLNPIEYIWDVMEWESYEPTNLQQLCDSIMSRWTKIFRGMFSAPC